MMNTYRAMVVCATLMAMHLLPSLARADGGQPPSFITVDGNGTVSIDTTKLRETGQYQAPPSGGNPGVAITVPGTGLSACLGCLTFRMYETAEGETVAMPTAYTALAVAATGRNPFGDKPSFALLPDTLATGALFDTLRQGWGISAAESAAAYANFFRHALGTEQAGAAAGILAQGNAGGFDPLAMFRVNDALNAGPGTSVAGIFVFKKEEDDGCQGNGCSLSSSHSVDKGERDNLVLAGTVVRGASVLLPPRPPDLNVLSTGVGCPLSPTLAQGDPASTVRVAKLSPEYPVVVGQDPARTGVSLSVSLTVPPVVYAYNVRNVHVACEGSGCGQPPGTGPVRLIQWETCDRVSRSFEDRLASLGVATDLSADSIAWITGELAARYPGAQVYRAHWSLLPGMGGSGGGLGTSDFAMQWSAIPFADPGTYEVEVRGLTTGTAVSPPRAFRWAGAVFEVHLLETALVK